MIRKILACNDAKLLEGKTSLLCKIPRDDTRSCNQWRRQNSKKGWSPVVHENNLLRRCRRHRQTWWNQTINVVWNATVHKLCQNRSQVFSWHLCASAAEPQSQSEVWPFLLISNIICGMIPWIFLLMLSPSSGNSSSLSSQHSGQAPTRNLLTGWSLVEIAYWF